MTGYSRVKRYHYHTISRTSASPSQTISGWVQTTATKTHSAKTMFVISISTGKKWEVSSGMFSTLTFGNDKRAVHRLVNAILLHFTAGTSVVFSQVSLNVLQTDIGPWWIPEMSHSLSCAMIFPACDAAYPPKVCEQCCPSVIPPCHP